MACVSPTVLCGNQCVAAVVQRCVFMEVFRGVQEEGSCSSVSSCMVIFRAELGDAVRPGVPGVSHGSCTPHASLGAVLMMAQGLWPVNERVLKSLCPPARSPSYLRAPTLALIPGCAGEPALSAPSNFQSLYWVPGRPNYLVSPVRSQL